MKKDRLYDLLTEIRDEGFTLNAVIDLFRAVDDYLEARDCKLNNEDPALNDYWQQRFWSAESYLRKTLEEKMNLDFEVYEFNVYD